MAEVVSTEAPLKRKLDGSSEAVECKKPRDCDPSVGLALGNSKEASAQSNGDHSAAQSNLLGENTAEFIEGPSKNDANSTKNSELRLSAQATGSSSASLQELEAVGEEEVLEEDEADEKVGSGELSGLASENASEDEGEDGSDVDEDDSGDDSNDSDDASDDETLEEHVLTSTSSSLQAEAAQKDKGKAKMEDIKGKGIMPLDKGKGKAIVEDETAPASDEDDAGYLSEDPLEEVDLNNILPTRTRRRSSTQHYDFVDHGTDADDDDDNDSDA
ncbi:hypothetical protein GOP47_0012386 [Adiantum capillus-veneris]|uniref:Uncharacterized protein n=1 Tax=Adiantum capillus-veneris TaxID=13818 RepID=A0A9D4ZGF6_ADICA|nr:hypothetical protein GOP47_0012386 [Adiantum capillus-veneris]